MPDRTGDAYVFDRYRLSADGSLLLRDGVVVALAPKVLQILLLLVQHAGEVVRKEHLLQTVWPDSFVEETGLTRNISLLRRALGDDGQQFVITVARVGYRFAASVGRLDRQGEPTRDVPWRWSADASHCDRGQPVVGRAAELSRLANVFEGTCRGQGTIIGCVGEPGIGKTTLVETFLHDLSDRCDIGRGRCSERLAGAEPHLPVLEALDEITAADPHLAEALRVAAPTWSLHVARPAQRPGANVAPPEVTGTGNPERLMRELTTFLEEASRRRPMVILIEDLHWADVATIDLLAHLAPRLAHIRLLILITYRQRELLVTQHPFARLRGELIARAHLDELHVSLLEPDAVREYLQAALDDSAVRPELAALVFNRTEGNPLFVVEVVRYLRQHGVAQGTSVLTRDTPDSLRGLIDRGLDTLDGVTRQLLSIAAVQGHECDSATITRVSGVAASDVEERLRRADHIHALVRFDREDERGDGSLSLIYRFAHVLYQDALIDSIAPSRRIEWALQIAEALLAAHGDRTEGIAGSLAVLFETGREFWKASQFFLATSRHAARLFAWVPASDQANRGLQCLRSARGVSARDRSQRELELTFARLVPLASIQGYASREVEQLTQHIVRLAEELGDVPATATALTATWFVRMVRGECVAAKNVGTRLATLAASAKNDVLLINAHMNAQIACHHLGEFSEARDHASVVMTLADRTPYVERCMGVFDPVVASLAESARNHWITGFLARAMSDCHAAVTLAPQLRHPDSLAFAWLFHAWLHGYRGDWQRCVTSSETGLAIARQSGSVQTLAWNGCVHGWAIAHVGDSTRGGVEIAAAIEASKGIMGHVALPQFSAMMAEVLLIRGDVAAALACVTLAMDLESSHDDGYFAAEVRRLSGVCLARMGRIEKARTRLREALEIARVQGATMFELRSSLSLAEVSAEEGGAAARDVLARFPEPEAWPEIDAARSL